MSAMTEIPAKTPKPMGKTERCVPGSWNLVVLACAESAAELAELVELAALSAAATPEPVGVGVAEAAPEVTLSVATADLSIVENP